MGIKRIFIILVDISGYTNFIRLHKISLLHAEKIIGELMECMLDEVKEPVIAHEILGDAISLYAIDDGSLNMADNINTQVEAYFEAFREREAYLMRECGFCVCEACNTVRQLKLKGIIHTGEVVFTYVKDILKISGEDVIIAHRMLKNSINSNEYIFACEAFVKACNDFNHDSFQPHQENIEGIGTINGVVRIFSGVEPSKDVTTWRKFKFFMKLEAYFMARLFQKQCVGFKNLPS